MLEISFNGANFYARASTYALTEPAYRNWSEGESSTQAFFQPVETFRERFDGMVAQVREAGFTSFDLWLAQLHPSWATPEHVSAAVDVLTERGVSVASFAGDLGDDREEAVKTAELAKALGAPVIGGGCKLIASDRASALAILNDYDLYFGFENHPEKTPADAFQRMGPADPGNRIGTTVDTGWWGTNGFDAAQAIRELGPRVQYVHLKDIRAVGGHDTCAFEDGVVPVRDCVRALSEIGYDRPVSIEHEPASYDPTAEVVASAEMLTSWLTEQSPAPAH